VHLQVHMHVHLHEPWGRKMAESSSRLIMSQTQFCHHVVIVI